MKERLLQILDLEQLSPSKFADIIGVQRSSISHVLSGRNKPSFDFLEKTLKAFPGLNAEWLMLGKGTMYERMGRETGGTLFDLPVGREDRDSREEVVSGQEQEAENEQNIIDSAEFVGTGVANGMQKPVEGEAPSGRIVQLLLVYDDGTFRALDPSL